MAKIIGGIGTSHTPAIGFAADMQKSDDPGWAPIFEGLAPVQQWLVEKKPDVILYVFNDHITSFFFDHYSQFALGVGDRYWPADEGGGPRRIQPIAGHPALAEHIAKAMGAEEFDLSYFQGKGLDHGFFSPMSFLMPPSKDGWPAAVVPIQCGVLDMPIPLARRFWKFGRALRKAVESYPEDLKVVVLGTGGLSHQVHGERCGFNDTEWDLEFLDRLEKDPESLARLTLADYVTRGGWEGAEVVMWLIMRGALSSKVKKLHQSYYLPSVTAIGSVIFEDDSVDPVDETPEQFRARIDAQFAGVEKLKGTYPVTVSGTVRTYRISHFLYQIIRPEFRQRFLADPEPLFEEYGLPENERDMIRRRDWRALIHYGVIFFLLEKLAAVLGITNFDVYAAMRGETVEDFQKTRNVRMLYSVAGDEDEKKSWDKK